MSIGEFLRLKKTLFVEQVYIIRHYYSRSIRFALIDLFLGFLSLFFNPYRICRKRREVYGETPLSTLQQIVDRCNLTSEDTWLELGSGRGKSCFWIAQFVGCRVIGIEKISFFVCLSRLLSFLFSAKTLFYVKDLSDADLSSATCIYIYSTCLSDEQMSQIARKKSTFLPGAKIVTISAPLPGWQPCCSFPVSFPWGKTEAYLHQNSTL